MLINISVFRSTRNHFIFFARGSDFTFLLGWRLTAGRSTRRSAKCASTTRGFVHPFFGFEREDGHLGTPLIFEVRGHDIDVSLIHREKLAKLTFYRMSEDAVESSKGADSKKDYNEQELKLSSFFADWPSGLTPEGDGRVTPKPD